MSGIVLSVLAGFRPRQDAAGRHGHAIGRYANLRDSFPIGDATIPAKALRDRAIARWARETDVGVDVRTSEELGIAVAAGIKPSRLVVHGDTLCDTEIRCAANLAVGRIVVGTIPQLDYLASCTRRVRAVLVHMTDPGAPGDPPRFGFPFDSDDADEAIRAVLAHDRLRLAGLHVRIGVDQHACMSCPAAVGNIIAEMDHIRNHHATVLTRFGLDCDLRSEDWGVELQELARAVGKAVDDACETMRFPRPRILLSIRSATPTPMPA